MARRKTPAPAGTAKKRPKLPKVKPHEERKKYTPTPELEASVERMSAYRVPYEVQAAFLGICNKTLKKYYSKQLKIGPFKAVANVANNVVNIASDPNRSDTIAAARLFFKHLAPTELYAEMTKHGIDGDIGVTEEPDYSGWSVEDLRALDDLLQRNQ